MDGSVLVPIWLLVSAGAAIFVLCLVTIMTLFAWYGIAVQLHETRSKLIQIDVYERDRPLQRVRDAR